MIVFDKKDPQRIGGSYIGHFHNTLRGLGGKEFCQTVSMRSISYGFCMNTRGFEFVRFRLIECAFVITAGTAIRGGFLADFLRQRMRIAAVQLHIDDDGVELGVFGEQFFASITVASEITFHPTASSSRATHSDSLILVDKQEPIARDIHDADIVGLVGLAERL
jgi:hypothetical protein